MIAKRLALWLISMHAMVILIAQNADSSGKITATLPQKYFQTVEQKLDKYTSRISSRTERTLEKLSRWESKIKGLLEKTSPETARRLFGNDQLTFAAALEKYRKGQALFTEQRVQYNEYRDKLTTSLKFLEEDKRYQNDSAVSGSLKVTVSAYEKKEDQSQEVENFIRERRKQLIGQAMQYMGRSRYLQKMDKEAYYYIESVRNFREILSDKKKAEEMAMKILNRIPAFRKFVQENSMIAALFRVPGATAQPGANLLAGLQTRASMNTLIQNQIAAGGPNAASQLQQNIQAGYAQLNALKDQLLQSDASSGATEFPGSFKPNTQKTKTLWQRLEFGANIQSQKSTLFFPVQSDFGLSAGYKLNDRSVIGLGGSFKVGWGKDIRHIAVSGQGVSLRSFVDWKLKGSFWLTGGYELTYQTGFRSIEVLKDYSAWRQSGLAGLSKIIAVKSKLFKKTRAQLLWDFLSYQAVPKSAPLVFRIGYNF